MDLGKKIGLMFVAKNSEPFAEYCQKQGVKFPLEATHLINEVGLLAGYLDCDVQNIANPLSVYADSEHVYDRTGKENDPEFEIPYPMSLLNIDDAIKACDPDLVVALDCGMIEESKMYELIQLAEPIKNKKLIKRLIDWVDWDLPETYYLLKTIIPQYVRHGRLVNDDYCDFLIASFIKENGAAVDAWFNLLNAINPFEKKEIVDTWVNKTIESDRILKELFNSVNSELKAVV